MRRRRGGYTPQTVRPARLGGLDSRHVRAPWSLPVFAFSSTVCLALAPMIDPTASFAMTASTTLAPAPVVEPPQTITASTDAAIVIDRSEFSTSRVVASAPRAAAPDAGTVQAIAYEMVLARGWDQTQFDCLVALWNRESHWNIYAENKTSGAYGIPQALPGEKMASVAADWRTNPVTQITWGLNYIEGRYTNPCGAWTSSENRGWY